MASINPETITEELLDRATNLSRDWPPDDFKLRKLAKDAEKLKQAGEIVDYELVMGVYATLRNDLDKMRSWFESALKKSGSDSQVVTNYAKSLCFWNLCAEALELISRYRQTYSGDVGVQKVLFDTYMQSGRFRDAIEHGQNLRKLGAAFENAGIDIECAERVHSAVSDLDDDQVATVFESYGAFLREKNLPTLRAHVSVSEPIEFHGEQPILEIAYEVSLSPDDAADLDFEGAMFMAAGHHKVIEDGRIIITIHSEEKSSADQAA